MQNHVEIEIQKKLKEGSTPLTIFHRLKKKYGQSVELENFLYHSGLYLELIEWNLEKLKKGHKLHWAPLLQVLGENQKLEVDSTVSLIKRGIKNQNQEIAALYSPYFVKIDPDNKLRTKWQKKLHNKYREAHQSRFEKILFFKNQHLIIEEKKALEEALPVYQEDPEFQTLYQDFKIRWAREIIQASSSHKLSVSDHKSHQQPFTNMERKILNVLYTEAHQIIQTKPEFTDDFALLFIFLGDFQSAQALLSHASANESRDWLIIEVLLNRNLFLEVLEQLERMELNYKNNPETTFASAYTRAQAYWGLKQPHMAIETLENLILIRPNYRSAQSFLIKWKQGQVL